MNKIVGITAGIICMIVVGIISGLLMNEKEANESQNSIPINNPENIVTVDTTQKSGPFQINKSQYKLGEKIFFRAIDVQNKDKGEIVFLRPINSTHSTPYEIMQFDGSKKSNFNQYVEPKLLESRNTCDKNNLIGTWTIWFKDSGHNRIQFNVIDEIIPGDEERYDNPVC